MILSTVKPCIQAMYLGMQNIKNREDEALF